MWMQIPNVLSCAKLFILCPCFHICKMKISIATVQILGSIKHNLCNSRIFVTWKVFNKYNCLKSGDFEPMLVATFPKGWNSRGLGLFVCVCVYVVGTQSAGAYRMLQKELICEPVIVTNHYHGVNHQLSVSNIQITSKCAGVPPYFSEKEATWFMHIFQ